MKSSCRRFDYFPVTGLHLSSISWWILHMFKIQLGLFPIPVTVTLQCFLLVAKSYQKTGLFPIFSEQNCTVLQHKAHATVRLKTALKTGWQTPGNHSHYGKICIPNISHLANEKEIVVVYLLLQVPRILSGTEISRPAYIRLSFWDSLPS